jgi:hypothetical protein
MAAKISISVAEPALLEWAKRRAEREGVSLSAVITEAIRHARQQEARARVLEWLGPAAELTPEREAAIREELDEKPVRAKRPAKRPARRR